MASRPTSDAFFFVDVAVKRLAAKYGIDRFVMADAFHVARSARQLAKVLVTLRTWSSTKKPLVPENLVYPDGVPRGEVDWESVADRSSALPFSRQSLAEEVQSGFKTVLDYMEGSDALLVEAAELMQETRRLMERTSAFREKLQNAPPTPRLLQQVREKLDTAAALWGLS
ncbi:MAG TPA: hypothetical protein VN033_03155 [Vulgatibacter sp.]|nr:hypothetical protein [Vulgatibacter sp.]